MRFDLHILEFNTRDSLRARPMEFQIVRFAIDDTVGTNEDETIVDQFIQRGDVAREHGMAQPFFRLSNFSFHQWICWRSPAA